MKRTRNYNMNKLFLIISCVLQISLVLGGGNFSSVEEKSEWERWACEELAKANRLPPDQAIVELSDWIRKLNRQQKSSDTDDVRKEATSFLLSIPGHAKYYQDKIESMRIEVLANAKKSDDEIFEMQLKDQEVVNAGTYERYGAMIAFPTLGLMPSAEAVAVLGHFLNDPEGRNGKTLLGHNRSNPGDDFGPHSINSEGATNAIRNLGIEHPPFKAPVGREREGLQEGEVEAWKNWWNDVNEGRRTYRFIGSPIEYGPDGPATKEVIQRSQRNMRRDEERAVGRRKATSGVDSKSLIAKLSKPTLIAGILAACALVAGAVWYFLRGRKMA